jgi:hypothetical protein
MESIFAGTPPLEAMRALLAVAASEDPRKSKDPFRIKVLDISRAHFCAPSVRRVLIRLPHEDPRSHEKRTCGILRKTMYGTLDAAREWEKHYGAVLLAAGFTKG